MSKRFTLDDIHAAAEKKYGSTWLDLDGGEVELVNVLRLPKEKRKVIMNIASESKKNEGETTDLDKTHADLLAGLVAACRTSAQEKILKDNIGHDTTYVVEVFSLYMEETEVGEASPSQD